MSAQKERPYYVLFVYEGERWVCEFGDYDRACVVSEQQDWLDHFDDNDRRRLKKNTMVIQLRSADQWRVTAIIEALNSQTQPSKTVELRFKLGL